MLTERTLRKHVSIIHAYSSMSVLQRKIVNILLYEATKTNHNIIDRNSTSIEYKISFANLYKAIKFNSNNTKYLKEVIDDLASIKIEWNLLKDKVPTNISFLNLRILHGAPTFYYDNTLNFSFHKILLNLVDNPTIYGALDIDLQSDFESKYGHALYENSTRFINLQKNKIIQLETFRKMLGIPENKYSSMRELTRNVICPSIEEVNDRANFVVGLDTIKTGRKVTGFEISVKNKKNTAIYQEQNYTNTHDNLFNNIKETFGVIKQSILNNILNNYSGEYILEKIAYTKKCAKKSNNGLYPIPYFISAIKHDYTLKEEQKSVKQPKIDNVEIAWNEKLKHLNADLAHWEKLLVYAKKSNNKVQIKNIKNIVNACQEKITKHHHEQTTIEEIV